MTADVSPVGARSTRAASAARAMPAARTPALPALLSGPSPATRAAAPTVRRSAGPRPGPAARRHPAQPPARRATPRHYLMCPPDHFAVPYAINPWMHPDQPVDRARARRQWDRLVATYRALGHRVDLIAALPGQPDMVFAANGGLVVRGRALGARFAHPERAAEGPAYQAWLDAACRPGAAGAAPLLASAAAPVAVNEGEGDFLVVGDLVLAGTGFRSTLAGHAEAQEALGVPVITLQLVDPRFYHLDTALAVLDEHTVAYYPPAFSVGSQQVLQALFPGALHVSEPDALVLGLNAVSDGRHVVLPAQAGAFAADLRTAGFHPVPVDLSELLKGGGSVKCCTLEIRAG